MFQKKIIIVIIIIVIIINYYTALTGISTVIRGSSSQVRKK